MRSIPTICSAIFRDVFVSSAPLSMDHPCQRVSSNSCHKEHKQWVLCHSAGYGSLALANVSLCLRVLFSCLSGVVLAPVVHFTSRSGRLIGNVVQGFPHLIQNLLGGVLLRWASLLTR
jgi:hypothetical protein